MTQYIQIEGGLVTVVETNIRHSVALSDWLPKIETRSPVHMPVLPTGTRAVWWDPTELQNQRLMVLVEREPMVINMNYGRTVHRLSIPWTKFFFYARTSDPSDLTKWRLEDYRIFWSPSKYTDPGATDLLPAFLPNVYENGKICFGATGADAYQTFAQRIDQTCNEFYVTRFNNDLGVRRPNGWTNFVAWKAMTRENPMGWTEWPDWESMDYSRYSFNMLCEHWGVDAGRTNPLVTPDPIPEHPLMPSFGRTQEWLGTLTTHQRARLFLAIQMEHANNPEAFDNDTPDPDEDDEENPDDDDNV